MERHRVSRVVLGTGRNHSHHLSPLEKQRKTTGLTSGQMQSGFSLPHSASVQLSAHPVLSQFRAAGLPRPVLGKGLPRTASRAGLSGRDHYSPLEQGRWIDEVACHRWILRALGSERMGELLPRSLHSTPQQFCLSLALCGTALS